ncbi:GNAT family N-acetyltransferase [Nonomuraea fuscirosea]|uniref:GNAT family N-acetyltransferase n=1 Tax=Nonomuraea fuscirosea TaxID=1291556 RepID=UPI002DD9D1D6|nr:GNAT family N-acetyltransferase [Nonomuraea fuscirosea]WSA53805.1 GNAT family N-acetyltransferase [Nonomuraea fuscirosea]
MTVTEEQQDPCRGRKSSVTVTEEPWDGADGVRLRQAMRAELAARYDMPDQESEPPTAETISVFLIARDPAGDATGCGALRLLDDGTAEIKRMYVTPGARGTGVATRVLRALEEHARRHGIGTLLLSTGVRQPDAIRFYEREGYQRIDGYGPYAGEPLARCFTLQLG